MQFSKQRIRAALAATLLLAGAFAAPSGASAQSVEAWTGASPYINSSAYSLNRAAGSVTFGNGVSGQTLPQGTAISASFAAGGGAAGNISSNLSSASVNCVILNC